MSTDEFEKVASQKKEVDPFDQMLLDTLEVILDPYADPYGGLDTKLINSREGEPKIATLRMANTIGEIQNSFKKLGILLLPTVDVAFAEGDDDADNHVHFLNAKHYEIVKDDSAVMGFVIKDKYGLNEQTLCAMKDNFLEPYPEEELKLRWPELSEGDAQDNKPNDPAACGS